MWKTPCFRWQNDTSIHIAKIALSAFIRAIVLLYILLVYMVRLIHVPYIFIYSIRFVCLCIKSQYFRWKAKFFDPHTSIKANQEQFKTNFPSVETIWVYARIYTYNIRAYVPYIHLKTILYTFLCKGKQLYPHWFHICRSYMHVCTLYLRTHMYIYIKYWKTHVCAGTFTKEWNGNMDLGVSNPYILKKLLKYGRNEMFI